MGTLYRGQDNILGRTVALKVLNAERRQNRSAVLRFLQEARIHSQLHHASIPPIHDVGRLADGRPYFALQYIDGQTLAQRLKKLATPLDELAESIRIFHAVCLTIAYAHEKGVIHRDLSTNNIMISQRGHVSVIDWGLSKVVGRGLEPQSSDDLNSGTTPLTIPNLCETDHGVALGTIGFAAPEQISGNSAEISVRSDVFGLGSILCCLLTGLPPYTKDKQDSVLANAKNGDVLGAFRRLDASEAPPKLVELAKECLISNSTQRIASAYLVAQIIGDFSSKPKPDERSWFSKLFSRRTAAK
jgi:serine/threonine protein kinase